MAMSKAERNLRRRIRNAERYGQVFVDNGQVYVVDPTTGEAVESSRAYRNKTLRNLRDIRADEDLRDEATTIIENFIGANSHWSEKAEGAAIIMEFIEKQRATVGDVVVARMIKEQVERFGYTLSVDVAYSVGLAVDYVASMASFVGKAFSDWAANVDYGNGDEYY